MTRSHVCRALLAFALAGALAAPAQSQVPEGWYVVASLKPEGTTSGVGGLFLVHPETPGAPIAITGLTHELTGAGPNEYKGARSVLIRPSDGALIVGEYGPSGTRSIDLHLIHISVSTTAGRPTAASVVSDLKHRVGGTLYANGASISQCALLPDGRVLVSVWGITSGPLGPLPGGKASLGIVDLDTGIVTKVPTGSKELFATAMCLDPSGTKAWIWGHTSVTPQIYTLYSVPVPAGGTPAVHTTVRDVFVTNMAYDSARSLLVAVTGWDDGSTYGLGTLLEIDPATGSVLNTIPTPFGWLHALDIERVTGQYVVGCATAAWPTPSPLMKAPPDASTSVNLANCAGWIGGIAMNATPEPYGSGTPRANVYTWSLNPNPGGLPTIGNAGFALQVTATPGPIPATSFYLVSLGQASINTLGITVLVDPSPAQKLSGGLLAPTGLIALPVPPDPSLVGMQGFAQSLHREAGGWAASDGVAFTLL